MDCLVSLIIMAFDNGFLGHRAGLTRQDRNYTVILSKTRLEMAYCLYLVFQPEVKLPEATIRNIWAFAGRLRQWYCGKDDLVSLILILASLNFKIKIGLGVIPNNSQLHESNDLENDFRVGDNLNSAKQSTQKRSYENSSDRTTEAQSSKVSRVEVCLAEYKKDIGNY